jgi:hypothetical protein
MIDRIREREISMLAMSAVAAGLQAIRAAYLFAFKRNVIQGLRSTSNQETYSDLKLPDSRCRPSENSGTISKANIKYLPPRGQLRRGGLCRSGQYSIDPAYACNKGGGIQSSQRLIDI